jgi:hypothetical protein
MATYTYYQSTLSGRAQKRFTCSACGCVFHANVERSAAATGGLQAIARERAARQLVENLKKSADLRPCPTCGLIPAEVIARRTEYVHGFVWLGIAAVAAVVAGIGIAGVIPFQSAALGVCGLSVLGVMIHLVVAAANPNRKQAANLEKALAEVANGDIQIIRPGELGSGNEPRSWTKRHTLGILLAGIAPLVLIVPAQVRTTVDLPDNPNLHPGVVAAGHKFKANLPSPTFQSVGGRWSATPAVELLNAADFKLPPTLPAGSRSQPFGEKLEVAKDQGNSPPNDLYVEVTVPDNPALDGKTLQLRATLNVVYPVRTSKTSYEQMVTTLSHEFPVVLARKADYQKFYSTVVGAIFVAGIGTIVGGSLLAWGISSLKKQGIPSELVGLEGALTP